jgi:hypothetical protein
MWSVRLLYSAARGSRPGRMVADNTRPAACVTVPFHPCLIVCSPLCIIQRCDEEKT